MKEITVQPTPRLEVYGAAIAEKELVMNARTAVHFWLNGKSLYFAATRLCD